MTTINRKYITSLFHYLLPVLNPEQSWVAFDLVLCANLSVLCAVQLSDRHRLIVLKGLGQTIPGWGKSLHGCKSSVKKVNMEYVDFFTYVCQ